MKARDVLLKAFAAERPGVYIGEHAIAEGVPNDNEACAMAYAIRREVHDIDEAGGWWVTVQPSPDTCTVCVENGDGQFYSVPCSDFVRRWAIRYDAGKVSKYEDTILLTLTGNKISGEFRCLEP